MNRDNIMYIASIKSVIGERMTMNCEERELHLS